jgi:hypothetical protein
MKILGGAGKWILNKAQSLITRGRFYTNFLSSEGSYAVLTSPITVSGNYKIRIDVQAPTEAHGNLAILGDPDSTEDYLVLTSDNKFKFQTSFGVAFTTSYELPADGVVHEAEVQKFNNFFIVSVDGLAVQSAAAPIVAAEPFTITAIGNRNGSLFFNGYLANLHIEENSVVLGLYAMDEGPLSAVFANAVDSSNPAVKHNIPINQVVYVAE